jgi:hypothetical protein
MRGKDFAMRTWWRMSRGKRTYRRFSLSITRVGPSIPQVSAWQGSPSGAIGFRASGRGWQVQHSQPRHDTQLQLKRGVVTLSQFVPGNKWFLLPSPVCQVSSTHPPTHPRLVLLPQSEGAVSATTCRPWFLCIRHRKLGGVTALSFWPVSRRPLPQSRRPCPGSPLATDLRAELRPPAPL